MSIEAVKKNFELAKKAVDGCQHSIVDLQRKCDALQESLPGLCREIENVERAKTVALDAFALNGDEKTSKRLEMARAAFDQAVKQQIEIDELIGATHRALKRQEAELVRLNEKMSIAKRLCWAAVVEDLRLKISPDTIEMIQRFSLISSTQFGGSYDFCLRLLCPQPGHDEGIAILQEFREKYQID